MHERGKATKSFTKPPKLFSLVISKLPRFSPASCGGTYFFHVSDIFPIDVLKFIKVHYSPLDINIFYPKSKFAQHEKNRCFQLLYCTVSKETDSEEDFVLFSILMNTNC